MHKYSEVCLSASPNLRTELGSPNRVRNILPAMTCAAVGIAITVWTVGSLTQKSERASQIELIDQRHQSSSDTVVPTPRAFPVAVRHLSTKESLQ